MRSKEIGMLQVPVIPPKARERVINDVTEVCIRIRMTEDLLEIAAPLIDYAKITDHTGLVDRLTCSWVKKKIALYNAHGIDVLPGGIPFQLAVVQGKVGEYFSAVKEIGFAGVEISDDVIEPIAQGYRE